MAYTTEEKRILGMFFVEKFQNVQNDQLALWLVDFVIKTQSEQRNELLSWLVEKEANNQELLNIKLAEQKQQAEIVLSSQNSLISNIKSKFESEKSVIVES